MILGLCSVPFQLLLQMLSIVQFGGESWLPARIDQRSCEIVQMPPASSAGMCPSRKGAEAEGIGVSKLAATYIKNNYHNYYFRLKFKRGVLEICCVEVYHHAGSAVWLWYIISRRYTKNCDVAQFTILVCRVFEISEVNTGF